MKKWSTMKSIIETYDQRKDLFLSLIDEEGTIVCANAKMVKTLHLQNPRAGKISFFDMLPPVNRDDFKKAIHTCKESNKPYSAELYVKNGYYHPMKWQISYLQDTPGNDKTYLCLGHKLLDDDRLKQFSLLGEKNYQLIVEGLNTGIFFQDNKGELIAANQKAVEIFDTTLEKLYQIKDIQNLWDTAWTITTEQGQRVLFEETPFMKALQTGKLQTQVLIVRMRNGEDRWIHFSSQPLFEEAGSTAYSVVSNIIDVTKEKKLSQGLDEREALNRVFMNQTPNLAWLVDEDANLVFANRAFYQYFGLNEKDSVNKNIVDLLPGPVANALHEKHIQVLQTGMPVEMVEKVKWADGTNFIFHINIFPIEGVTSKKMLGGHAVNLADKYAVEKQLREANDKLLLLSRTTSDAIWEWDMLTGRIFRNDILMDMVGYHFEEPKGLLWWHRRIHPEDRNRIMDKIKDATDKGQKSWEDRYRFKCADGTYKYVHDRGYVVYENGLPVKMIGSLQDITDLKDLENQLTEEKLERQKEISETVIRVQEKERTRIGHELHDNVNQILSTVKLFVDMLTPVDKKEKDIKAKSIEYVVMAIDEIRKLSKELVVPQLIGKGLADSIQTLVNDINISSIINVRFAHDHENELLSPGKKVTLFRIVQEQLKNILKHSKAKHVNIYLESKDGNTQLIIKDDGVGFDPKQTHRGIGLSNIHERTRFYNGTVDIQTSPGYGCTIAVTIPAFQ